MICLHCFLQEWNKKVLHFNQATKVRIEPTCQVKLDKHTITSNSIVNLATEPLYYNWSWDPSDMHAMTLKDPGHVDFMLNNLRKFVNKVNE